MKHRLFYMLNMAQHRVYKYADQHAEQDLGVTITQMGALFIINENEGCLLKELAGILQLNNSALTGLANRLEQNGLIKRKPCPDDGRASRLYLTKLGKNKVSLAIPLTQTLTKKIQGDFSEEEMQTIVKFLNHLIIDF